jgi:hypothetical protein
MLQVPLSMLFKLRTLDGGKAAHAAEKGVLFIGKMFIIDVVRHCQLLSCVATRLSSPCIASLSCRWWHKKNTNYTVGKTPIQLLVL